MSYRTYFNRTNLATLLLGFSSGLPISLSGATLSTWYATTHVSTQHLGYLSLVSFPYLLKFLWAPLLDRYSLFGANRRFFWILVSQLSIIAVLCAMALQDPHHQAIRLAVLACLLAFVSATQDIAVDAYRVEIFPEDNRALGAALHVNGYRLAMLVSGGLALIIAAHYSWFITYLSMAALMGLGLLATLLGPRALSLGQPKTLIDAVLEPLKEFLHRPRALWLLVFLASYKLGDSFAISLIQPFLLRVMKMSLHEIGSIVKLVGFGATLLGTTCAGLVVPRIGYRKALLLFGLVHAGSFLAYLLLYWTGPQYTIVSTVIFIDNFSNGCVIATLVGLMMGLCHKKYSATQYALLSTASALSRITIGPLASYVASRFGWPVFFYTAVILSLPSLVLAWVLKGHLQISAGRDDN